MFFAKKQAQPADNFAFPEGPHYVPADLTKPTETYKRHATIAMLSLGAFMLLYLALMAWFAWTSYAIFDKLSHASDLNIYVGLAGICSAFLAVFMAKGLVFLQKSSNAGRYEIKQKDHPRLFKFLHTIAAEAGAPQPHRVFLSPQVNAAVFYDLSFLNLFFASKKNLEIGLGLVNVLNLGELKAVLAHEFGHFAQKTMAIGRWVYVAQQVATQIVNKRDALDSFLSGLSRFDLRVAWIGWIMQFVVWSLRSLIDTLLMGVILAQRALSREMEFQADLVSVSLCGSDALITALHKLGGADEAMQRAINFAAQEKMQNRPVEDLFEVQTRILEHLQSIFNDPHYGAAPPPAEGPKNAHRVFKASIAAPPRMWATHPANTDRENNAKFTYVECAVDERSAWELFPNAGETRRHLTAELFQAVNAERSGEAEQASAAPRDETLARLDEGYSTITVSSRYRGAYLGRPFMRQFRDAAEAFAIEIPQGNLTSAMSALYSEKFGTALEKLRELYEEKSSFEGIKAGYLKAPGGVVRWRGDEIAPRELPKVLLSLQSEITPIESEVRSHDQSVRAVHQAAAQKIGQGWDAYHRSLVSLLHYSEHTLADLADVEGVFHNVFAVVTADGKVSSKELDRLVDSANDLFEVMKAIYGQSSSVVLDSRTKDRLKVESMAAALGEFKLVPASSENMGTWLNVIDGWTSGAKAVLADCRSAALQELLICEDEIAAAVAQNAKLPAAPAPAEVPFEYPRLLLHDNRPRQTKLRWWDRFQTADGWLAATARTLVALTVVGSVIALGVALTLPETAAAWAPDIEGIDSTVDTPSLGDPSEFSAPPPPLGEMPSEPVPDTGLTEPDPTAPAEAPAESGSADGTVGEDVNSVTQSDPSEGQTPVETPPAEPETLPETVPETVPETTPEDAATPPTP